MDINDLTGQIIGSAIEVHKALGPDLLESAYEECLCHEFDLRGISYKRQHAVPFSGIKIGLFINFNVPVLKKLLPPVAAVSLW